MTVVSFAPLWRFSVSDKMTPIERVSSRNRACSKLGLSGCGVTQSDIRDAYRQQARRLHPDLNPGNATQFIELKEAYEFLQRNADDLGIPSKRPTTAAATRPTMRATESRLSSEEVTICADALGDLQQNSSGKHIPSAMRRRGRRLTYIVKSKLNEGLNKIAVPTGALVNSRKIEPQVLEVDGSDTVNGAYVVPAEICAKLFPGANRVSVEFQYAA